MTEIIYEPNVSISPHTNRPIEPGQAGEIKVPSFLCVLCNTMLNTPVQAIQHFTGKAHSTLNFKRKDIHSSSARVPPRNRQNSFQEIFVKQTPQIPPVKQQQLSSKDSQLICQICNAMFNSPISAQQHFTGKKHAANLAASKLLPSDTHLDDNNVVIKGMKKKIKDFFCDICDTQTTSPIQLQQHHAGVRHQLAAGILKEAPDWWKEQQDQLQKPRFPCNICKMTLNSEARYSQHLLSSKHKEKQEATHKHQQNQPKFLNASSNKGPKESLYCEVCQITLNSQVQLGQHLTSLKHKEKQDSTPQHYKNKSNNSNIRGGKRPAPDRQNTCHNNFSKQRRFSDNNEQGNRQNQGSRFASQPNMPHPPNIGKVNDRIRNLANNSYQNQNMETDNQNNQFYSNNQCQEGFQFF